MTEKIFKLKENHTDVKTEIMAGVTTFMTMAYILAINPSILGSTGMDPTAVLLATCIASVIGTVCMGLMANLPFVLSAGMGLNAYMAYTVVAGYGYPWQVALLAVFVEGIVFIVLSLTNVREAIFNAIPVVLKKAVSVGIGLYIAFIGLQNAGLCVDSSATLVTITGFRKNFTTSGICALLTIVGLFITIILYIKKVRGSILMGIVATWVIGMICQLVGLYVPDAESGYNSLFPTMSLTDFSKLGETFGQCFKVDMHSIGIFNFIVVVFSFLFVDLFDTLGTLIGVCSKADMLDDLISLLGGRVAEALSLNDISTGASNDLQRATSICRDMVSKYGMSDELGPVVYSDDNNEVFLGKDYGHVNNYSEATSARIDEQIEKMMRKAYSQTESILKTHYDKLELVAETLIKNEKISGDQFTQLMKNGFIADEKVSENEDVQAEDTEIVDVENVNEDDLSSNDMKD